MLDIGWTELVVIAIVLIIVVGPKDLPPMLRAFGRMTTKMRGMAGDFRKQFDEALKEADLDDVRKTIGDAQKLNPVNSLREAINPLRQMGNDLKSDLQKSVSDTPKPQVAAGDTPEVESALGIADAPGDKPADKVAAAAIASAKKQVENAKATEAQATKADVIAKEAAKPAAKRAVKASTAAAGKTAPAAKAAAPATKAVAAKKSTAAAKPVPAGTAAKASRPAAATRTAKTKKGDA